MATRQRPVHNTNSPNFIKLDYMDLTYIKEWAEFSANAKHLSDDELVTLKRVELMMEFMEEKRKEMEEDN